jgi:hypothetical protein
MGGGMSSGDFAVEGEEGFEQMAGEEEEVFAPPKRRGEELPPPKYPALSPGELRRVERLLGQLEIENKVNLTNCNLRVCFLTILVLPYFILFSCHPSLSLSLSLSVCVSLFFLSVSRSLACESPSPFAACCWRARGQLRWRKGRWQ